MDGKEFLYVNGVVEKIGKIFPIKAPWKDKYQ